MFVSVLKAEIPDVDCSTVTPCVEHAKCDRKTGQCLCDKDYSVRWDGLCGKYLMLMIQIDSVPTGRRRMNKFLLDEDL